MADENAIAADLTFERCEGKGAMAKAQGRRRKGEGARAKARGRGAELLPGLSNENFPGNYETCGEAVFAGYIELIETVEGGAT